MTSMARACTGPAVSATPPSPAPSCITPHSADKLIADLARQNPKEVTIVALGPLTVLAAALDREPELPALLHRIVCVGGTFHEPGNAGPCSEFHFFCDPPAAQRCFAAVPR